MSNLAIKSTIMELAQARGITARDVAAHFGVPLKLARIRVLNRVREGDLCAVGSEPNPIGRGRPQAIYTAA